MPVTGADLCDDECRFHLGQPIIKDTVHTQPLLHEARDLAMDLLGASKGVQLGLGELGAANHCCGKVALVGHPHNVVQQPEGSHDLCGAGQEGYDAWGG